MIQASSGLLPALIGYYKRLEADPKGGVAEYGFSREKIHFAVVLEADGTLFGLDDIRERNDKGKPIPRLVLVPDGGGRSGTGLKPCFCWDNTGYALGCDNKGNPGRAAAMLAEFRKLHLTCREELASDEGFSALCRFLESWEPARAEKLPNWEEVAGQNVVFRLRGREGHIHETDAVRSAWLRRIAAAGDEGSALSGVSLVSGEEEEIARLHPLVSGVAGANTTGAAIVSFNLSAFESYGKSQSYNAPVGVRDAFRYTTALNRLLADNHRRARIGDATVVFWSDRVEAADAEDAFGGFFADQPIQDDEAEHAATLVRVRTFLDAAREGRLGDVLKEPDAPFYVLGLSPNASRLSIRFWLAGTVAQFADRLSRHIGQLEMIGARPDDPPLSIRRLLIETAREPKDIPPYLAGAVTQAVLNGTPYPRALFETVLRRVRLEGVVNHVKAACLKAFLVRNGATAMDYSLNKRHPEPSYHSGRMLALLALAQEEALKSVNAGVVRRNMGAAMATPGLILGRLLRAAEVGHFPKLEGDLHTFVRDELQSVCLSLGDRIPAKLNLVQQGIFALGFYQEQCYLGEARNAIRNRRLYRSSQGDWMASQLEVKVADALARAGIHYVYEVRSVLKSGQERWPDFFIEGTIPREHVYLEVLGFTSADYDRRWETKLAAYEEMGITPTGGHNGRLAILDWRRKWGPNPEKSPVYPSDKDVIEAIRPYLPLLPAEPRLIDEVRPSNTGGSTDE